MRPREESQEKQQRRSFYEDEEEYQQEIQNAVDKLDRQIGWYNESNGNSNGNRKGTRSKKDQKQKFEYMTFKYSSRFRGVLHEAILLNGSPAFIKYENG